MLRAKLKETVIRCEQMQDNWPLYNRNVLLFIFTMYVLFSCCFTLEIKYMANPNWK